MTCSIGFRAPARDPLAHELLQRALDADADADADEAAGAGDAALGDPALYQDRRQAATATPACIPAALQEFGAAALQRWLAERLNAGAALGEVLSEPKPGVWFDGGAGLRDAEGVRLDRRTRMLYDARHVFINGESYRAGGRDARRMRELADRRVLSTAAVRGLSAEARELLAQWAQAGWLHAAADDVDDRNREDRR
jgi:50S ribosomal protein L16 3-hydroxylase